MAVAEEFIYYAPSGGGLCHGVEEEADGEASTSGTRTRRGRHKGQEEDGRLRQVGGTMEREEDRWPHSDTVEMPTDERPDAKAAREGAWS